MTSDQFLDEAILEMAKGGPRETWKLGVVDGPAWREDRDTWAARVVDDALALATRRERKLAEIAAVAAVVGMTKRNLVMPPTTAAECPHQWSPAILTSNPPKRLCERCGFTEVVPGAEFVKGHEVHAATLDAEAEALMQEWAGDEANLDWQNITANGRIEWRRVAQKAREMHRRNASLEECVRVYFGGEGFHDGLRAILEHLGVEVTP